MEKNFTKRSHEIIKRVIYWDIGELRYNKKIIKIKFIVENISYVNI
jgi:hypothetical protein